MSEKIVCIQDLYQNHNGWLKNFLYQRLGNQSDAADVAHDAFVKLLTRKVSDPRAANNRSYLCRVAKSLCVDLWRRRRVEQAWLDELAFRPEHLAPSEEERFLLVEALVLVDAMLDQLPNAVRKAFVLSQIEGNTYVEIANKLDVSERTVKRYMAKAMLKCTLVRLKLEAEG